MGQTKGEFNMKTMIAMCAVMMLQACAVGGTWTNATRTDADLQSDIRACYKEVGVMPDLSSSWADRIDSCVAKKGWTLK